jgi:RNA polymerase sigma-70 factor (TIGR02960 family)
MDEAHRNSGDGDSGGPGGHTPGPAGGGPPHPAAGGGGTAGPPGFEDLVRTHRRELFAHCYRILGSFQDAEDALQEALLGAWRGLPDFEGRSSARTWLYRICTNACLRLASRRPRRLLSPGHGPPRTDTADLGEPVTGPVWLEPWPEEGEPAADTDGPEALVVRRESVELAFVAALQRLPATQRAVLILREVLRFSAAETANILDTTPAAVNSALQRARAGLRPHSPETSQRQERAALGDEGHRKLLHGFMAAWERADVPALLDLLTEDVRFTMPPLPAWFDGREATGRFLRERVFATPWRLVPRWTNGQPGFACYLREPGASAYTLGALNVLSLRSGRISRIDAFLDPGLLRRAGLAPVFPASGEGPRAEEPRAERRPGGGTGGNPAAGR